MSPRAIRGNDGLEEDATRVRSVDWSDNKPCLLVISEWIAFNPLVTDIFLSPTVWSIVTTHANSHKFERDRSGVHILFLATKIRPDSTLSNSQYRFAY